MVVSVEFMGWPACGIFDSASAHTLLCRTPWPASSGSLVARFQADSDLTGSLGINAPGPLCTVHPGASSFYAMPDLRRDCGHHCPFKLFPLLVTPAPGRGAGVSLSQPSNLSK